MKTFKFIFKILALWGVGIILGSIGFCENFNPDTGFLLEKLTAGTVLILISAVGSLATEYLKWGIEHRKKLKYQKHKRINSAYVFK